MATNKLWSVVLCLLVAVACLASFPSAVEGAVSCGTVAGNIAPCLIYLTKGTPKPASTSSCCAGVKKLDGLAVTTAARQAICKCLQSAATTIKPIPSAVSALPGTCGATHPFSLTQDCSKVP